MDLVPFERGCWSVADVLDRLVPPDDGAVSVAARARLHALAAHLPAPLTRVVYLESWIGQPRPRLDLIVKIEPRDRDALAELVRSVLRPELRAQPGWAHVARFARAWATAGSLLHENLRAAWLEFDLDPLLTPDAALRSPRVFVDFTREAQCWPSVEARLDLATEVLWALSGSRPPRTLSRSAPAWSTSPATPSWLIWGCLPVTASHRSCARVWSVWPGTWLRTSARSAGRATSTRSRAACSTRSPARRARAPSPSGCST